MLSSRSSIVIFGQIVGMKPAYAALGSEDIVTKGKKQNLQARDARRPLSSDSHLRLRIPFLLTYKSPSH